MIKKKKKKERSGDRDDTSQDAPLKEILLYAFGNIENGFSMQFFIVLQQILIVVMFVNPLLIGLVVAIKSIWDSVTDPIMAYITDNTRTRWGRRIPYILVGGVLRMILLVFIVLLLPRTDSLLTNDYLETDKFVTQAQQDLRLSRAHILHAYRPETVPPVEIIGLDQIKHKLLPFTRPSEKEALRENLAEARETLIEIEDRLPHIIAVLETNLLKKIDWAAHVDASTEHGDEISEKRQALVQEVRKRLAKAENLAAETTRTKTVLDAALARMDGRLDVAQRREADRVIEHIKIEKLEPVAERMPGIIERWENEKQRLSAPGPSAVDIKPRKKELYLDNAERQLQKARSLETRINRALDQAHDALARIEQNQPVAASVAMKDVEDMVMQAERLGEPPKKHIEKNAFEKIVAGWKVYMDPASADQRKVIVFLLITFLLFTTLSTVNGVPYYALGIELCPSYDGRTRVTVYRSFFDKAIGIVRPWIPPLCFMAIFATAFDGLLWVTIAFSAIGIPSTIIMCMFVRERTRISTKKKRTPLLKSMLTVMQSSHFWRVFLLFQVIGITWGIFMQFGFYLNIYWVMGSAFKGAGLSGLVGTLGWGLAMASLPLINWGARRFQKHNVIQVAVILMACGAVLQWFTIDPKYPLLQLVNPFFISIGISSFYVIMNSLLADVTDADELKHGERREGMFAAVMSFVGKMVGALTPMLAMLMLVASGFDATLEYNQTPQTILNMRLLYSIIPGCLMLIALLLLWRYPLNRKKMAEIKAELQRRHDAEEAAGLETTAPERYET